MDARATTDWLTASATILDCSPTPMIVFTTDLVIIYVNRAHERMTGRARADVLDKPMFEAFAPKPNEDGASAEAAIREAVRHIVAVGRADDLLEQQHDVLNSDGTYEQRFWSMVHWPIKSRDRVIAIVQRSEDVTRTVRTRRTLLAEKDAAERSAGVSFFSYEPVSDAFDRSPAVDQMFGFKADEAGPYAQPFFARVHADDLPVVQREVSLAIAHGPGTPAAFDYRVLVPGENRPRHIRVRAGVELDPADNELKLFGAFVDMTDLEHARRRLEELSQHNADLVVESHHRIKNSLAIASAMVAQQVRASENIDTRAALELAATRIRAISDVHAELYRVPGVETVDAGELVDRFSRSFERTVTSEHDGVEIWISVERVLLPSRFAVSLTLALNEFLTNAVKYGSRRDGACIIDVALQIVGDDAQLRIANQISDSSAVDIRSDGVGSRLVRAFAQQMAGTVIAHSEDGRYEVIFQFPCPQS